MRTDTSCQYILLKWTVQMSNISKAVKVPSPTVIHLIHDVSNIEWSTNNNLQVFTVENTDNVWAFKIVSVKTTDKVSAFKMVAHYVSCPLWPHWPVGSWEPHRQLSGRPPPTAPGCSTLPPVDTYTHLANPSTRLVTHQWPLLQPKTIRQ